MDPNVVLCPFCEQPLLEESLNSGTWFTCVNPKCLCADGGTTMYGKHMPLKWIEWKRKQVERKKRC